MDALVSVLLAPTCAACEQLLDRPTRGCVCPACWSSIIPLTPPLCVRCGDLLPSSRLGDECVRCRRTAAWDASVGRDGMGRRPSVDASGIAAPIGSMPPLIDAGRAAGVYTGALRAIVHAFKYRGRRSLARPLARLMRERAGELLQAADALVPVPLHRSRARQRGFNQADDLARALDIPVLRALRRVRATLAQSNLPAARRHRNVRGAFALTRWRRASVSRKVEGRCLVLIDDVATTGATLRACAQVLKAAGAREVRALTAARAVRSRPDEPPSPPSRAAAPR